MSNPIFHSHVVGPITIKDFPPGSAYSTRACTRVRDEEYTIIIHAEQRDGMDDQAIRDYFAFCKDRDFKRNEPTAETYIATQQRMRGTDVRPT